MNKILLSLLALAALSSCSKDPSSDKNTITLRAGIQTSVLSKAAVEGGNFANLKPAFYLRAYQGTVVPSNTWNATRYLSDVVVNSTSGAVSLANTAYYPADAAQKLFFYAFAPAATDASTTTAPIVGYTLTGAEDILWAKNEGTTAAGFDKNSTTAPAFAFTHLLKQVKFKIVADASFVETDWSVKSITVLSVNTKAALNLSTGSLVFSTQGNIKLDYTTGNAISSTPVNLAGCLMFEQGTTFNIKVVMSKSGATDVTFPDAAVTLTSSDAGVAAGDKGVSHLVQLTFKQQGITATATITDWKSAGNSGNVDLK